METYTYFIVIPFHSLEYKTDPYSDNDPMSAICSRGDLGSPPQSGGCTDSKVFCFLILPNHLTL